MASTTLQIPAISFEGSGGDSPSLVDVVEPEADSLPEKGEEFRDQSPVVVTMTLQPYSPPLSTQSYKEGSRSSSSGPVCRICHEGDGSEALISPCECLGSLAAVHRSCLEKWLSTSNSNHCEICKHRYVAMRQPRPVWHWFRAHGLRGQSHGFYGDVVCLLVLAPLCLVSVYLCGVGAAVYMRYGVWEGSGLALLCCFLLGTFLLWCAVTVRFHWKMINDWRRAHQVVRLVLPSQPARRNQASADRNKTSNNNNNNRGDDAVADSREESIQVAVVEIQ